MPLITMPKLLHEGFSQYPFSLSVDEYNLEAMIANVVIHDAPKLIDL